MVDVEKVLWCVKNGDLEELKIQLSKTDQKVDAIAMSKDKRTAIIHAADYGQTKVVSFLIEAGSNVNAIDKHGISALLAAIWEEHAETAEVLLKNGANKNMKSPAGNSYRDEAPNDKIKALLDKY